MGDLSGMEPFKARATLWTILAAMSACACVTPNPRSVEDCGEQTVRAFRETLAGDTLLVQHWSGSRTKALCRDGEAAAACEARARAALLKRASPERSLHSCTSEPGHSCLVARHDGEVSTLRFAGDSWNSLARALWARWGKDEVSMLALSIGQARAAIAAAPENGDIPRFFLFLRAGSPVAKLEGLKAAAQGWTALKINRLSSAEESADWLRLSVSCRPKDKPHPSAHKGPWHCFPGPSDLGELIPNECYKSEEACLSGREELIDSFRLRKGRHDEIGSCSAAPRVHCYEMWSEYSNFVGWQSYRLYYCYPSRERCEKLRPEHPWHAMVKSACFEAGAGIPGG